MTFTKQYIEEMREKFDKTHEAKILNEYGSVFKESALSFLTSSIQDYAQKLGEKVEEIRTDTCNDFISKAEVIEILK